MRKIVFLSALYLLAQNGFSQSCNFTDQKTIVANSLCSLATALATSDQTMAARDQVTLIAGFSVNTASLNHKLTITTDHSVVPANADYLTSGEIVNGLTRTLDKTNFVPGTIGGSIDVSPTGAANYSIPIQVSPGSHGMVPGLSINYSSQSGNGLLGYGWNLGGLSSITRANKNPYYDNTTAPITLSTSDALELDGQRLISTGTNIYSPENDPYTTVQYYSSGNYFTVITKDGMVTEYGNTSTDDSKAKFYPISSSTPYCWAINKITDPEGNYIKFYYLGDNTNGDYRINEIKYTGNGSNAPYNSINFSYEKRTDSNTGYIAGRAIKTSMILTSIQVLAENALAREYTFSYFFDGFYSKLNQIGYNAEGVNYNPTIINWGTTPSYTNQITSESAAFTSLNSNYTYFGDVNGDGRTDIILWNKANSITVNLAQSNGTYISNNIYVGKPLSYENGIVVIDIDNDGKDEILNHYITPVISGVSYDKIDKIYYNGTNFSTENFHNNIAYLSMDGDEINNNHQWYYSDFNNDGNIDVLHFINNQYTNCFGVSIQSPPTINNIVDVQMLDFDGDGANEFLALTSSGYGSIWKYNGTDFVNVYGDGTTTYFGVQKYFFTGDFNGDGKSDYISYSASTWSIWYSTGNGFVQGTTPSGLGTYSPANSSIYCSDMNEDGLTDIVYALNDNVYVYISQGQTFVKYGPYEASTVTPVNIYDLKLYAVDLSGDGQPEIIYGNNDATVHDSYKKISFTEQLESANNVMRITNGNNIVTDITYTNFVDNATDQNSFPLKKYRGGDLLVSNVQSYQYQVNTFSDVDYTYSDGRLHLQGKGFLGFATFTSSDLVSAISNTSTFENNVYMASGLYLPHLKSTSTYKNGNLVSTTTNGDLYAIGGNQSLKFFYPLTYTSTATNSLTGFTTTNTIVTFNSSLGRVTDQKSVTSDGWTMETKPTYVQVSGNISKLTQVINSKQKGAETYSATSTFTYDVTKPLRLTSTVSQGVTTTFSDWDTYGNVKATTVSVTDGTPSRSTSCTYDAYGRFVVSSTDVANNESYASYRATDGATLSTTDINGLAALFDYSAGGNTFTSLTTMPDGNISSSTLSWDNSGTGLYKTISSVTNGNSVTTYYNAAGWKLSETSIGYKGASLTTTWVYNADGTLASVTYPGLTSNPETFTYDTYGRIATNLALNKNISYTYSANAATVTDNISGQTKTQTFDGLGNVTNVSATTGSIAYTYWASGKVKDITTGGSTTSMTYDAVNLTQLTLSEPNTGTTTYTYNGFGQLKTQTDAKNQTTTLNYDNYGRLTSKSGAISATYTYHSAQGKIGLLQSVSRGSVTETYDYDALCRPISSITTGDSKTFTTTFQYDAATDRLASVSYPTGLAVSYVYDAVGNVQQINNAANGAKIWAGDTQNGLGQWTQYSLGNNLITSFGYNSTTKMLETIKTGTTGNPTSVQNLGYTFNSKGQLTQRTDGSLSESFEYDALDRLTKSTVSGLTAITYAYNTNGNISSTSWAGTYSYDPAHPHAVKSLTGAANPSGSSPNIVTNSTYTADNKIASIETNSNAWKNVFTYGANDSRFKVETYSGASLQSSKIYVNNSEFGYNASGTLIYKRTIISAPTGVCAVYQDSAGVQNFYYVHTDNQGSWVSITNSPGTVVSKAAYDAWGRPRNPNNWQLRPVSVTNPVNDLKAMQPRFDRGYTGHEMMAGFGLINMNGRLYDPYVQSFLSPDNYVQDPSNTQNYNRYSYCLNNPLRYTDPSGYVFVKKAPRWSGASFGNKGHGKSSFIFVPGSMGYSYVGDGTYVDNASGNDVSFDEVYDNYIKPNGTTFYGEAAKYVYSTITNGNIAHKSNSDRTLGHMEGFNDIFFHYDKITNKYYIPYTNIAVNPWKVINSILNASKGVQNSTEGGTQADMSVPFWTPGASIVGIWGDFMGESFKANPVKVISKTTTALKTIGWAGEAISLGVSFTNLKNNPSSGNIARFQTSLGTAGMNLIPEVGSGASFFTSAIDNAGAFNWYYNALDKVESLTGCKVIPPGLYPFPLLIPKSNK